MSPRRPGLRVGTRESELARWQAEHVASALRTLPGAPEPELVLIRTEGDRIQDVPLSQVQGKAFFTKEIEEALLRGEVDVAVHSLKDLATQMPEGLALGAVMEREDPRDALLVAAEPGFEAPAGSAPGLDALPRGARVGTSSLRRRAFLARWRPDLELAELRGNVPTRIRKLDEGLYDGIVLAAAGVKRLGRADRISAYLPLETFLPAVSQGAVGVQIRADDEETVVWVRHLEHPATRWATAAERALLRRLEGGCQVPVGALAEVVADSRGVRLRLRAVLCSLDGRQFVEGQRWGDPAEGERPGGVPAGESDAALAEELGLFLAEELGVSLAEELLERGGGEILDGIRKAAGGG